MTRAIVIAFTLFTLFTAHVSAAHEELQPQVAVQIVAAPDGFQLDWDGAVLREHGEEWCSNARCVNSVLARIGEEWTYSVTWKVVGA
jgi:hypothetical protein